jgi:hypothetical protein
VEDEGDGCFGGGGDGGEVSHFAALAGAELLVEVEADAGDGESAVEVGDARNERRLYASCGLCGVRSTFFVECRP